MFTSSMHLITAHSRAADATYASFHPDVHNPTGSRWYQPTSQLNAAFLFFRSLVRDMRAPNTDTILKLEQAYTAPAAPEEAFERMRAVVMDAAYATLAPLIDAAEKEAADAYDDKLRDLRQLKKLALRQVYNGQTTLAEVEKELDDTLNKRLNASRLRTVRAKLHHFNMRRLALAHK
jgi:hypothetical protein